MRKTFKFRLFPTTAQETKMLKTLGECRWLYNHLLEQRASLNILALGLQSAGIQSGEAPDFSRGE